MNILIACEFSGTVREAFRKRGHNAWSCDLLPAEDGSPFHHTGDVRGFMNATSWDLMIAHPPCTYLTVSGLHWNKRRPERAELTERALDFVASLWDAPIGKVCIENPVGCINTRIPFMPRPQIIQPYEFGADASKKTCLWLRGLPELVKDPANRVPGRLVEMGIGRRVAERWGNQTDSGQNRLPPTPDRWALRSITYPGIAEAMAEQWG